MAGAWRGAAVGADGKAYCAPGNATSVLVVDPVAGTTTLVDCPVVGSDKFCGAVRVGTKVYFVPHSASVVMALDTATGVVTTFGSVGAGTAKWCGGALGLDGKVYCAPSSETRVLVIDPATQTTSFLSTTLGAGATKYGGMASAGAYGLFAGPGLSQAFLRIGDPRAPADELDVNVPKPVWKDALTVRAGGVGVNTAPVCALHVSGNAVVSGNVFTALVRDEFVARSPFGAVMWTETANVPATGYWGGVYMPFSGSVMGLPRSNAATLAAISASDGNVVPLWSNLTTAPADGWRGGTLTADSTKVVLVPHNDNRVVVRDAGPYAAAYSGFANVMTTYASRVFRAFDSSKVGVTGGNVTTLDGVAVQLVGNAAYPTLDVSTATTPGVKFVSNTSTQGPYVDFGAKTWTPGTGNGFTFAIRFKHNTASNASGASNTIFDLGNSIVLYRLTNNFVGFQFAVASYVVNFPPTGANAPGTGYKTVVGRVLKNASGAYPVMLRINGEELVGGLPVANTVLTLNSTSTYLGRNYTTGVNADVTIQEFLVFDAGLSDQDVVALEKYLAAKWSGSRNAFDAVESTVAIANTVNDAKYSGAVTTPARPSGAFFVPGRANAVGVFDTVTSAFSTLANTHGDTATEKWRGGALGGDGKMYCAPFDATGVLSIDPVGNSSAVMTPIVLANGAAFAGAVTAPGGDVVFVPHNSTFAAVLNPGTGNVATISLAPPVAPLLALDAATLVTRGTIGNAVTWGGGLASNVGGAPPPSVDVTEPCLPAVTYSGASTSNGSYVTLASPLAWTGMTGSGFTVAAYARFNATQAGQRLFEFAGPSVRFALHADPVAPYTALVASANVGTALVTANVAGGASPGSWRRVVATLAANSAAASWTVWVDGSRTAGASVAATLPGNLTTVTNRLAAPEVLGSFAYAAVSVRECLWMNAGVDDAAALALDTYLRTKWSTGKWSGGCVGPDDRVYCAPYDPSLGQVLVVDTSEKRATLTPVPTGNACSGLACSPMAGNAALVGFPLSGNAAMLLRSTPDSVDAWKLSPYVNKY